MTEDMMRAEAGEAEREARSIWAKIDAAREGSDALIPAGCERDVERASDLMRRARALNAEADEMRAEAEPVAPQPSPPPAPAAKSPGRTPVKPVLPLETADAVALRILRSDSTAPVRAPAPQGQIEAGAVDTVDAIARRIAEA